MSKLSNITSRGRFLGAAVAMAAMAATSAISPMLVSADQVQGRSLSLTSSAAGTEAGDGIAGSGTNGQKAGYTFNFKAVKVADFSSWSVSFCDSAFGYINSGSGAVNPLGTCSGGIPAGLDTSAMAGGTVNVEVAGSPSSGWTIPASFSADNVLEITNTTPVSIPSALTSVQIQFVPDATHYITNPSATNYTTGNFENSFFGHTAMYSDDAYGTVTDDGTVVSATTESIGITSRVQETLKFSVGTDATAQTAACEPLTNSGSLLMGDVNGALSTTTAHDTYSFFRLSTNAVKGTDVQYAGKTLISGDKFIAPIGATATNSTTGNEQFGLGVDAGVNDTALATDNPDFVNGTTVNAVANYNGSDGATLGASTFAFDANDADNMTAPVTLASASTGNVVDCDTKAVRYVGNISNNTPAGIYKTSINYIAVPKY